MLKYDKKIKIESLEKLSGETLIFLKNFNHVIFNNFFNKPIDNLPLNITKLELGDYFKQDISFLPISLEELSISKITQEEINNLPINLKVLNLKFVEEKLRLNKNLEVISFQDFFSIDKIKNDIYEYYFFDGSYYFSLKENQRKKCKLYVFKKVNEEKFMKNNSRFYFDTNEGDLIMDTNGYNNKLYIVSKKKGYKEFLYFDDENHFTKDFDFSNLPIEFSSFDKFPLYYWEDMEIDNNFSTIKINNLDRLFLYNIKIYFNKDYSRLGEFQSLGKEYLVKLSYPNNEFFIYLKNKRYKKLFEKFYLMNKPAPCIKPQSYIFKRFPEINQLVEFYPLSI